MQKKYSNFRMFCEYLIIGISSYLIMSLLISLFGSYSLKDTLGSVFHFYGIILVYWWIPLFRISDMLEYNKQVSLKNTKIYLKTRQNDTSSNLQSTASR